MRKRILRPLLPIVLIVLMQGADARMAAAPKVCKLAEVHPPGYPTELADEKFAKLVQERTNGGIVIKVCHSSLLGSEDQVAEQAQLGVIEFIRVSTSPVIQFYKPIGVFSMPYIFRSQEHMWKVLNGPIGKHFLDSLCTVGLIGIGYFDGGARDFYANRPLKSVADLRGLRIRVQNSIIMVNMVKTLGATAAPIAYAEVYSALQTGVVDGAENNIPSWVSQKHYKIARYMIKDAHLRLPEVLIVSGRFWQSLTDYQRAVIREAAQEATDFQIKAWNEYEVKALAQAKAAGCTIAEANVPAFQAALAPLYRMPEFADYKIWIKKIREVE